MKAKLKNGNDSSFKPITIEITFETQSEMIDFKSILNFSPICDYLRNTDIDIYAIREAIPCEDHSPWAEFSNRLRK